MFAVSKREGPRIGVGRVLALSETAEWSQTDRTGCIGGVATHSDEKIPSISDGVSGFVLLRLMSENDAASSRRFWRVVRRDGRRGRLKSQLLL